VVFQLAEMSLSIRLFTVALLVLPVGMAGAALIGGGEPKLLCVAAPLAGIYLLSWLWFRPSHFELGVDALRVVWPIRRREVPFANVETAEIVGARELRDEHGWLLRIGVGGLWGGFGRLWSSKGRHLDFYVSRTSPLVLVRLRRGRSLLITPEQPERFVEMLRANLR
jgi:hypothetical protein